MSEGPGIVGAALVRGQQRRYSLLLGAPGDIIWPCSSMVLINELLYHLPGPVHLLKVVFEDVLLAELLEEGPPLP